jgi:hypothetical protein
MSINDQHAGFHGFWQTLAGPATSATNRTSFLPGLRAPNIAPRVLAFSGIRFIEQQLMKEDFQSLIRRWHPEVPEPVAFRREVWSRIERGEGTGVQLTRFLPWLARPKIMSLAALIAILGGALVGSLAAGQSGRTAYLHAVNPYAQVVLK